MLILNSTDKLSLTTSSGADIDVHASFVDCDSSASLTSTSQTFQAKKQNTQPTTATTTDIVAAPAANFERNVRHLNIRNIDGSTSNDVTVQIDVSGVLKTLFKCTLLAGEELVLNAWGTWFHYDLNGSVYGTAPAASDVAPGAVQYAVQADMEAGTSNVLVLTPGRAHFHPSSAKCWLLAGLTGNILASYNITSLTDTGTGVLTITIANDFSSSTWAALATIEFTSTTVAQSCTTDSRAAGSLVLRSVVEAGSSADPVSWSFAGFGDL